MIISVQTRRQQSRVETPTISKALPRKRVAKRKKPSLRPTTVALYASVFVAVVAVIAAGYSSPSNDIVASVDTARTNDTVVQQATSVNEVVATAVAANVAETTHLPVATNVANLSVSLAAKNEVVATGGVESVAKQQIIQSAGDRRELITYVAKPGDTVDKLALEYGVSKDTIKWANELTSDALDAGANIIIPPVDGVVYTVQGGDTVAKLAEKYGANADRIVAFNDLELEGLKVNSKIIIPSGKLPETERPGYVAPQPVQPPSYNGGGSGNFMSGSVGNKYAYGYCTWYAYERRAALGKPVGSFWGNANTWAAAAAGQGFTVSKVPVAGAVFQTAAGGGGYGHVGVIESVDHAAGTVTYSDMNGGAGWNRIGRATIPISQAQAQWVFIY